MEQGAFEVLNLDEVRRAMKVCAKKTEAACSAALQKGGAKIIADAQRNLRSNGTNTTGHLSNSGKTEKMKDGSVVAGFFAGEGEKAGYAEFVENGRRSGRMPPPRILQAWVRKKLRIADRRKSAAVAFALAVHIAKKGTKAHPFFAPAVRANQKAITDEVVKAARSVTGTRAGADD